MKQTSRHLVPMLIPVIVAGCLLSYGCEKKHGTVSPSTSGPASEAEDAVARLQRAAEPSEYLAALQAIDSDPNSLARRPLLPDTVKPVVGANRLPSAAGRIEGNRQPGVFAPGCGISLSVHAVPRCRKFSGGRAGPPGIAGSSGVCLREP